MTSPPPEASEEQAQPPTAATRRPAVCRPWTGWVLAAAGAMAVVGSVTPWAKVNIFDITVNGMDGDGVITLACALIVAAMGTLIGLRRGWLWTAVLAIGVAAISTLVAAIDVGNISGSYGPLKDDKIPNGAVSTAYGIWLVIAGGVLAIAAGLVALIRRS